MKSTEHNNNSQKVLKSKYLEKSNRPTKIMLTDLCPQQKVKIGELIRTLQIRKKQNIQLEHSLSLKQQAIHIMQQKIKQLEEYLSKKQEQFMQIKNQLFSHEKLKIQRDIEFQQLKLQIDKIYKSQKVLISMSSNTDSPVVSNSEIQTQFKKKKTKSKQVQVQMAAYNYENQKRQFYRPNTKSFQKIMNDKKNNNNAHFKNLKAYPQNQDKQQKSKKLTVQELQNINKWEQIQQGQDDQNMQIQDTDQDDQFQTLARKWLQLKQKNIHQIKQSDYSPLPLIDSEYPNKYKKILVQQFNIKNSQQDQVEIDQIQLNKALKSKKFSASRILNNSHESTSRQNNRNSSKSINKQQQAIQKQKREFFNKKSQQSDLKIAKKQKIGLNIQSTSRKVDFYQSDIMDIVESLNS